MKIEIRHERPEDADAVARINERAFGQRDEAELVGALRSRGASLVSLVAWKDDSSPVGHILFTPLLTPSGEPLAGGAALGPMAVLPECQRQGIGSRLVERGLDEMRSAGQRFVVVLGHPEYYPRFGFVPARNYAMASEFDVPPEVFMVLELEEHALDGWSGPVRYQGEFGSF